MTRDNWLNHINGSCVISLTNPSGVKIKLGEAFRNSNTGGYKIDICHLANAFLDEVKSQAPEKSNALIQKTKEIAGFKDTCLTPINTAPLYEHIVKFDSNGARISTISMFMGGKRDETHYKDGSKSRETLYKKDGSKSSEINYKDGKKYTELLHHKDGKQHWELLYDKDGILSIKKSFKEGLKTRETQYNKDGSILKQMQYKDEELVKPAKTLPWWKSLF